MLQEFQVRGRGGGGLKNDPILRGCVDFFWNNPLVVIVGNIITLTMIFVRLTQSV